jgi:hypothetical protein
VSRVAQSVVSGYGLDDRAIEVRSPAEAKEFSCSLCVQTGSGAHPASCTMGTGGPFPGDKTRPSHDIAHSHHLVPSSRMSRSYTSFPPRRLHAVWWDSFILTGGLVTINMAFEVTIKSNTTLGVNLQEPFQSRSIMTYWHTKKVSNFGAIRISEFRLRDTELY